VQMPELDGLEATRQIRALGQPFASVPIIALTANAFPEDVRACLAAGMDQFVAKPVSRDTLLNALMQALSASPPTPPVVEHRIRVSATE
jgi:CheY-like chemotaxis protein